jgi:hypothetical protein
MSETFQPTPNAPDQIDDGASDVMSEDEIVHVPHAVEELVESQELTSTYPPEVPHWEAEEEPTVAPEDRGIDEPRS